MVQLKYQDLKMDGSFYHTLWFPYISWMFQSKFKNPDLTFKLNIVFFLLFDTLMGIVAFSYEHYTWSSKDDND